MPIDFSYLEGAAPQEESTPVKSDTANVTIRVDADSMLLCDGEYIDQVFKAGVLTKIQMGPGQHLLEFLYTEDPDIKIEKEVDFPESGKSYLVLIKGLKELVDAAVEEAKKKAEEEAEAKRQAEEEAQRLAEEAKRKAAEEEARIKAEAEAKKKAEIKKIVDLAEDYYRGRNGKSKDYEKAVANYLIAAEAGDAFSLYSLGWCYEKGQGVEQSAQEAVKWYRKAAEQGEKNAKECLEILKKNKEEHCAELTAETIVGVTGGSTEEEANRVFDVVLKSAGGSKLYLIKVFKEIAGLTLGDAKALVDAAPTKIKEGVSKKEAESIKRELEEAGAVVEIR